MALVSNSSRPLHAPWVPVAVVGGLTALAVAVIWLVAVPVGPEACALSMPAPRNCFEVHREAAAVGPTIALIVLGIAILAAAMFVRRRRLLVTVIGSIFVLTAATASYLAAAWIPAWAFPWA